MLHYSLTDFAMTTPTDGAEKRVKISWLIASYGLKEPPMTAHSALEVFEKLKAAINEALQNEGFNEVLLVAEELRVESSLVS